MNNLEFALEMKNKRLASGLSQGELASLTHVSRYSINRFENGKANASKETQNIILRCLNYYICDKPFYLLIDYLSVRFPTTDALEVIRKVLGIKADYFIHYRHSGCFIRSRKTKWKPCLSPMWKKWTKSLP